MMQTMRRDTHLVKKGVGRFGYQIINSYNTMYISTGFNEFKNAYILRLCSLVIKHQSTLSKHYNERHNNTQHKHTAYKYY